MKKLLFTFTLILGSALTSPAAFAVTKVVAKWGTDSPTCSNGSDPCLTIGHALSLLTGPSDTIVVHPGIYVESNTITIDGLKLISLSGYSATVIQSLDPSINAISVAADNVSIGEKGKGFSIEGGLDGLAAASFISNLKVEGNRARGNSVDGFRLAGIDPQVRFNIAENNRIGFNCNECTSAVIQKNTARSNTLEGFLILNTSGSVNQNISLDNGEEGLNVDGAIVNSNVSETNGGSSSLGGIRLNLIDGGSLRGNIVARNNGRGLNVINGTDADVKHNLSVANTAAGIGIDGSTNMDFENNTAIQNDIGVENTSTFVSFFENTTYANTTFGIDNNSGSVLFALDHFLGFDATDGLIGVGPGLAAKPNLTKVGIAKGL